MPTIWDVEELRWQMGYKNINKILYINKINPGKSSRWAPRAAEEERYSWSSEHQWWTTLNLHDLMLWHKRKKMYRLYSLPKSRITALECTKSPQVVSGTPNWQPMSTLRAEAQQYRTTQCTAKQTICFSKAASEIVSITPVAHWASYLELQAKMQKILEDENIFF